LFYDLIALRDVAQGWIHAANITTPERVRWIEGGDLGIGQLSSHVQVATHSQCRGASREKESVKVLNAFYSNSEGR
jgi:hypothetical protein